RTSNLLAGLLPGLLRNGFPIALPARRATEPRRSALEPPARRRELDGVEWLDADRIASRMPARPHPLLPPEPDRGPSTAHVHQFAGERGTRWCTPAGSGCESWRTIARAASSGASIGVSGLRSPVAFQRASASGSTLRSNAFAKSVPPTLWIS